MTDVKLTFDLLHSSIGKEAWTLSERGWKRESFIIWLVGYVAQWEELDVLHKQEDKTWESPSPRQSFDNNSNSTVDNFIPWKMYIINAKDSYTGQQLLIILIYLIFD